MRLLTSLGPDSLKIVPEAGVGDDLKLALNRGTPHGVAAVVAECLAVREFLQSANGKLDIVQILPRLTPHRPAFGSHQRLPGSKGS